MNFNQRTYLFIAAIAILWSFMVQTMEIEVTTKHVAALSSNGTMPERSQLFAKLARVQQEMSAEKEHHAHTVRHIKNTWDRKVAVPCLIAAGIIAVKTGVDVVCYTPGHAVNWPTLVNFSLDGITLTGTTVAGLFHLIRSCTRKPKIE